MLSNIKLQLLPALLCLTLGRAQRLDKQPNHDNLDYLKAGLENSLRAPGVSWKEWGPGWIAEDCKTMTINAKLNPADVKTYNVKYSDCGDAWVMCHHKDSPMAFADVIMKFGKLPAPTRGWVKHIISLPDSIDHAYNWGGNIAMFGKAGTGMTVWVHEAGHSLDLLGAYALKPLSSAPYWIAQYKLDSRVPDPYSQSNQVENVAQNTVVASYNSNVPGGIAKVDKQAGNIFHQYATVMTVADNAGRIIRTGGTCTHRLVNSRPVPVAGKKLLRFMKKARDDLGQAPEVTLTSKVKIIPPKEFHTRDICGKL